jgi:hypothetical protein
LFLASFSFLFSLEPIVEFRARLIAALHIKQRRVGHHLQFIGSSPDAFFRESVSLPRSFVTAVAAIDRVRSAGR